ncbi:MAG: ribosomal protein L13e [Candidatus Bathyarchaeota archaeon]|jgi:large subunit ribosomal protein L13e|nr:ribosomal protein L13e [Candidatus Bathyarchaeota archaeon A05DMB-3]MDH7607452.1 ribosomal protein L13e [Candidatus Bathyarchaeota archaeon]
MEIVKPTVVKKGGNQRLGKGFSLRELKEAGLNVKQALKLGIFVDYRRRTFHEENVKALEEFLATKKASEPKPKRRKPKSEKQQK